MVPDLRNAMRIKTPMVTEDVLINLSPIFKRLEKKI